MSLAKDVTDLVKGTSRCMNDYDQRSALGMADSWVRGSNVETPLAKFDDDGPINRDGLATALIAMLGDSDKDACRKALHTAREWVNAPFANDPKVLAWRKARHERYPEGIGVATK